DEAICLSTPPFFQAVGQYYEDFSQTSDDDVRELLNRAAQEISREKSANQQCKTVNLFLKSPSRSLRRRNRSRFCLVMTEVQIPAGRVVLSGNLTIPEN